MFGRQAIDSDAMVTTSARLAAAFEPDRASAHPRHVTASTSERRDTGFFRDRHGLKSIYDIGVNNVTYETDYPHTDTTWPHTMEWVEKMMVGIPDEIVYKILRGNALRMLGLGEDLKVVN